MTAQLPQDTAEEAALSQSTLGRFQALHGAMLTLREEVEHVVFSAGFRVVYPALHWWVNHGLRRDDLAEDLREFAEEVRA